MRPCSGVSCCIVLYVYSDISTREGNTVFWIGVGLHRGSALHGLGLQAHWSSRPPVYAGQSPRRVQAERMHESVGQQVIEAASGAVPVDSCRHCQCRHTCHVLTASSSSAARRIPSQHGTPSLRWC